MVIVVLIKEAIWWWLPDRKHFSV